jgi:hypothetical protein
VNAKNREYATHTLNFFEIVYRRFICISFFTFADSIASPSGTTPLICSATYGPHLEVCKLLVSSKADLAARNRCGRCQRFSRFSFNQSHPLARRDGTARINALKEYNHKVAAFLESIGAP